MRKTFVTTIAVSAAVSLIPAASWAELKADEVWESWRGYVENFGYQVEVGNQISAGGTLTLEGVSMSLPVPNMTSRITLDWLKFSERGDGSVEITMAPDAPFALSGDSADGAVDVTAVMRQSGLTLVASGEPGDIAYDYNADTLSLGFDKFIIEGEALEPVLDLRMAGLDGSAAMKQDDMWRIEGKSTVGTMNMDLAFEDPDNGQAVTMSLSAQDISSGSRAVVPIDVNLEDPEWMVNSGFSASGNLSVAGSAFAMSAEGEEAFTISSQAGASDLDFDMGDGGIAYAGSTKNQVVTFVSPALPLPPLTVSLAESAFDFAMPLMPTEEPADFRFVLRLLQLGLDDMIWQMFDPSSMLPHDPADLVIDVSGKAIMPEGMMNPGGDMGGVAEPELHNLDVNEIRLSVGGAELRGNGAFTFDNSDLDTFGGMPAPVGSIGFDLFGFNGLLDTLIAMGYLPEDQAIGARMMLGLFARPGGGGEDHLTSEIEFREGGSVFANGQQMR